MHPAGELPSRALAECAVFEEDEERGILIMRDLQTLDGENARPLEVVGRVRRMAEDGSPLEGAPAGPLVRLSKVSEWSVEYDELTVTVWVSTATADYKLVSPAPLYAQMWEVLMRKTAIVSAVVSDQRTAVGINGRRVRSSSINQATRVDSSISP